MKLSLVLPAVLAAWLLPEIAHADRDQPPLSIYGFARLDMIVDDSQMSDAQAPMWVEREAPNGEFDGDMSIHPRLSRIGLELEKWRFGNFAKGAGKIEVDFQSGSAGVPAALNLRHAYFTVSWGFFEILAGQTWDAISPLFPAANNDSMMWNAGNTGARRPQLRFTATPKDKWRVAVALGMAGAVDRQDLDDNGEYDGLDAAVPMFQGIVEYRLRNRRGRIIRMGVWGHSGAEALDNDEELVSQGMGAHLILPLNRSLTLLGEFFYGRNLSDIRGGIGQGVNPESTSEIASIGGWIETAHVFSSHYMFAVGAGFDDPVADQLSEAAGLDRDSNSVYYIVQRYRPNTPVEIGLEYQHWRTRYLDGGRGIANRVNLHLSMFF